MSHARGILRRNRKEHLLDVGRTDIVDLNEDDELRVFAWAGTKVIGVFSLKFLPTKNVRFLKISNPITGLESLIENFCR